MLKHFKRMILLNLVCVALTAALAGRARAAQPAVAVLRVGDGSAALSGASTAAFLEVRAADGSIVSTVPLPTASSGANQALTLSGTSTLEGLLTRSANGQFVCILGYAAMPGTASVNTTSSLTVNRVVARIDYLYNLDTTTVLSDAASGSSPRSVVSTDGTQFWIDGGAGGVRYCLLSSTTSVDLTSSTVPNVRQLNIFAHQLYVSSGTSALTGVGTVGSGLPTTGAQSVTRLPGLTDVDNPSSVSFFLADLSAAVSGVDTLYVADNTTLGVSKFSFDGSSWTLKGTADTGNTHLGLAASVSGSTVTLFMTRSAGSELVSLVDTSGYNANFSGTTPTLLATAPANTAYRGVALAPLAPVDLAVAVADAPHTVTAGSGAGNLVYTVSITNNGPAGATGVQVTNTQTLPSGVALVASSASMGTFDSGSGIWSVGALANAATATLTLTLTVGASTAAGAGVVSDTAAITASDNPLTNTNDDTATKSTDVNAPAAAVDLTLAVADEPHTVTAGSGAGNLVYTVSLTNNGPSDATGVQVTNTQTLPAGVALIASSASMGTFDSGSGIWSVGALANAATATLTLTLSVGASTVVGAGVVSDTAAITASDITLINTNDDTATKSTDVTFALLSGPTATHSTAGVGQVVTFSIVTAGAGVTITWDFGDGSTGAGAAPTHTYAAAGSFAAKVTINGPGGGPVSISVPVTVKAPLVGTGNDSDGDGFSDSFETLAGSDANSAASTPTKQPATADTIQSLTISKASIKLNFSGAGGKDSISFSGTLSIPAGFKSDMQEVGIDVGGVSKSLPLDAKGGSKVGGDSLKIAIKSKNGMVDAQTASYKASFSKGTFAAMLADEGLTGDTGLTNQTRTVVFTLVFNDTVLQVPQMLTYSVKQGKTGSAKQQ